MKRVLTGKIYDTETAAYLCTVPCHHAPGNFAYHNTNLYRTRKGRYFIAGEGGPTSMWAQPCGNDGYTGGNGIRPLDTDAAREIAERAELTPEEMTAAGFDIEEA